MKDFLKSCIKKFLIVFIFCTVCAHSLAGAHENIRVLGLFSDKVLLQIDGENKVMKVGDVFHNVELISATSHYCTIKKDGEIIKLTLNSDMHVGLKTSNKEEVRITKGEDGLYRIEGKINRKAVLFLVDTGASHTAMNISQANALGIDIQADKKIQVETASGKAQAYQVTLPSVQVGDITVYDVAALVVDGEAPFEILLGMSFLKRFELTDTTSILELRKKY